MAVIINNLGNGTAANNGTDKNCNKQKPQNLSQLTAEEVVMLATTIALSMTHCKTNCEVKTLINLVNLIEDNLIAILAQRNICAEGIEEVVL